MTTTKFTSVPWKIGTGKNIFDEKGGTLLVRPNRTDSKVQAKLDAELDANMVLASQAPAMYGELERCGIILQRLADDGYAVKGRLGSVQKILAAARGEKIPENP